MQTLSAGPLRVYVAGGSDNAGGGNGPAVVLCHGFGAAGNDLVSLSRVVDAPPGTRWFFPEAPGSVDVGYGMTGRAWWMIDVMRLQVGLRTGGWRTMIDEDPGDLPPARTALEQCLSALVAEHGVRPETTVLGGFSQGAMLATEIALHAKPQFAGLALLSGTLLAHARWRAAASEARGLSVFQSHGREDPVLPFGAAEALRDVLTTAGAEVTFVPFRGGHEIPQLVVEQLGRFVRARLGAGLARSRQGIVKRSGAKAREGACACGSGAAYEVCCAPYHRFEREAPDARSLMRARYAAFAVGAFAFLWATLHEGHDDRGQGREAFEEALRASAKTTRYVGLRVLDDETNGNEARVLFFANLRSGSADVSFVELSDFVHDGHGWRYLYGVLAPKEQLGALEGLTIEAFERRAGLSG